MNSYIDQLTENIKLQLELNKLLIQRIQQLETSYQDIEFRVDQLEKNGE